VGQGTALSQIFCLFSVPYHAMNLLRYICLYFCARSRRIQRVYLLSLSPLCMPLLEYTSTLASLLSVLSTVPHCSFGRSLLVYPSGEGRPGMGLFRHGVGQCARRQRRQRVRGDAPRERRRHGRAQRWQRRPRRQRGVSLQQRFEHLGPPAAPGKMLARSAQFLVA